MSSAVAGAAGFIQITEGLYVRASEIVEVSAREIRTRSGLTYNHKTPLTDLMRTIRACERQQHSA